MPEKILVFPQTRYIAWDREWRSISYGATEEEARKAAQDLSVSVSQHRVSRGETPSLPEEMWAPESVIVPVYGGLEW